MSQQGRNDTPITAMSRFGGTLGLGENGDLAKASYRQDGRWDSRRRNLSTHARGSLRVTVHGFVIPFCFQDETFISASSIQW